MTQDYENVQMLKGTSFFQEHHHKETFTHIYQKHRPNSQIRNGENITPFALLNFKRENFSSCKMFPYPVPLLVGVLR